MCKRQFLIILCMLFLVSLACTFPAPAQTGPGESPDTASDYPDSPEGVVRDFLIAYQEGTDDLAQYVMGSLDNSGAVELLDINGMMMGFLIQSASVRPDPPGATIEVGISLGNEEVVRVFNLTKIDERWMIVSIGKLFD